MDSVFYYIFDSVDPFYNLALEQLLMELKPKGDIYVLLWQNDNTVVVGRHQNTFEEVDIGFAKQQNIKIVRRNSGGGAVFHDLGNINYSFIVDYSEKDRNLNFCLKEILGFVLDKIDIQYNFTGRNDIVTPKGKISGCAVYNTNDKTLFHGTLLVNSNLDILKKVLTRNNKISDNISVKSNNNRVCNISD